MMSAKSQCFVVLYKTTTNRSLGTPLHAVYAHYAFRYYISQNVSGTVVNNRLLFEPP